MSKLAINGGKPVRTESWPSWPIYGENEEKYLLEALHSRRWCRLSYGEPSDSMVGRFEDKFAAYHDAKYAIAVASGTATLEIACRAAGIGVGDEVIVQPHTYYATATAVLQSNAIPVFADIEPDTDILDPARVEEAITERTKAIIPVYMYGHLGNLDGLLEVARKHQLFVIGDCARTHGSEWRGKKIGAFGDINCFSLQASKLITSGEGGIITTNDEELAGKCVCLHHLGRGVSGRPSCDQPLLGWTSRMSEFSGAVLLAQLERLDKQLNKRLSNVKRILTGISDIDGLSPLRQDERATRRAYHEFVLQYDSNKFDGIPASKFAEALRAEGIPTGAPNPTPAYRHPLFEKRFGSVRWPLTPSEGAGNEPDYTKVHCPVAESFGGKRLSFGQAVLLGDKEDMDDVVLAIRKVSENLDEMR